MTNIITNLNNNNLESLICFIRGQQVILDSDLAMLYGVETKALNQAVKRNINRFPEDFMFQLTIEEYKNLKTCFVTSSGRSGFRLPYAFTLNGVAMLSSVLKSNTAVGVNIRIMKSFSTIPQLVNYNAQIVQGILNIEQHQQETEEKIKMILEKIEKISPKNHSEHIFSTGYVWDAWVYISELVRNACKRVILIDNYVDDRVLSLLTKRSDNVSAIIYSRYNKQFIVDLNKHNMQYPKIEFKQLQHKHHDRFLIIDDKVYLLGASLKDIGDSLCAVIEMSTKPEDILALLK